MFSTVPISPSILSTAYNNQEKEKQKQAQALLSQTAYDKKKLDTLK